MASRVSYGSGLILAMALATVARGDQKTPSFSSKVQLVQVDVTAVDREGRPVRGLSREDFRLFDEGKERAISSFQAVEVPAVLAETRPAQARRISTSGEEPATHPVGCLVFVFDGYRLGKAALVRGSRMLRRFIEASPDLADDLIIGTTQGTSMWSGHSRDLQSQAVFDRVFARVVDGRPGPEGSTPEGVLDEGASAAQTATTEKVSLLGASMGRVVEETTTGQLITLMDRIAMGRSGRTLFFVVSGGTGLSSFDRRTRDVTAAATRHRVTIYGLDGRGLRAPGGVEAWDRDNRQAVKQQDRLGEALRTPMGDQGESWTSALALATGGRNFQDTESLASSLAAVVEASHSYYLLGFEPDASARPGRLRSVSVKLGRTGLEVHARAGYYLPRPGEKTAPAEADGSPLVLRVSTFVRGASASGQVTVRLVAECDPATLASPSTASVLSTTLESTVDVRPVEGGEARKVEYSSQVRIAPEQRRLVAETWVPLVRDLDLAPGAYEARIVVKETTSGRSGTLRHYFEVPPPRAAAGTILLSTPVISDLFRADGSAREVARLRFSRARPVECVFDAFGATGGDGRPPRLVTQWTLRSASGEDLRTGEERPRSQSGAGFAFALPLNELPPGEYWLTLRVSDLASGATAAFEERLELAAGAVSGPNS